MERRRIEIRGTVQGVGFRPYIYNLATEHRIGGSVQNRSGCVLIRAEGDRAALDRFLEELPRRAPPLAHIDAISWVDESPLNEREFRIVASEADAERTPHIAADAACCADCLRELFDPADRRYRYPFLNCTNCGPRLTIVTGAPYDRERTTMAGFAMCAECRAEYDDPTNRRFHAQPVACPRCGPRLELRVAATQRGAREADPITAFAAAILEGAIGALKGLGGYHLVCDARNEAAVLELRRRKERDEKPFAIMVRSRADAERICRVNETEAALLETAAAPIVLLQKRESECAAQVAPNNPCLGVMLPYTPLHHLLMEAVRGAPLVMTSGNRSDEPIVHADADLDRLAGIADLALTHDRPIHVRCDDSVVRVVGDSVSFVRRSRGYAPRPLPLPFEAARPILAVGGQLKGTFALARGREAVVSHHLGDLDHYEAYRAFERDIALYEQLFGIVPEAIACDMHPDYASSRYAAARAATLGVPLLTVQHHHAHLASGLAEHGLDEPAIGVIFDGSGLGTDGTIWGGEFLTGGYQTFRRVGHFRPIRMPGGEQAIREPWRMALAHLLDAQAPIAERDGARGLHRDTRLVMAMLERNINSPWTSSVGRLFDAVASIAGVRDRVSFEGQAGMELEALTASSTDDGVYPSSFSDGEVCQIDTRPLIAAVAADADAGTAAAVIARRFHSTLAAIIVEVCERLRATSKLDAVLLSGGVFMNALLSSEAESRLIRGGFRVYRQRIVPPNDGGLSLGQAAIATATFR